jgi:hypothetical protein
MSAFGSGGDVSSFPNNASKSAFGAVMLGSTFRFAIRS